MQREWIILLIFICKDLWKFCVSFFGLNSFHLWFLFFPPSLPVREGTRQSWRSGRQAQPLEAESVPCTPVSNIVYGLYEEHTGAVATLWVEGFFYVTCKLSFRAPALFSVLSLLTFCWVDPILSINKPLSNLSHIPHTYSKSGTSQPKKKQKQKQNFISYITFLVAHCFVIHIINV